MCNSSLDLSTLVDDLNLQRSSSCSISAIFPPTSVVSLSKFDVQVESDESVILLNSISSHFSVKSTKYSGRSCFANSDLAQGTIIYECSMPLSSTIARPFRKEVCESCFNYFHGKTLKFKLTSSKKNQNNSTSDTLLALYFCSQSCMDKFIAMDIDDLYLESLLNVESLFIKGLNQHQYDPERERQDEEAELKLENELKQTKDIELFISQKWEEAEINYQFQLSKLKAKQRKNLINLIPKINENEYLEIKYILGILFQMYKHDYYKTNNLLSFELQIFQYLQSNDIKKVLKYPYLLYSYTNNIYKFLKISTSEKLQPYITPSIIRSIIGKNLTNVFGIWSRDEPYENKECFGYSLYPSASFFNHSCNPNVIKIGYGTNIIFKLLKNIFKNEELFINYGISFNDDRDTRQKYLQQWLFDCSCQQCIEEIQEKNIKK